MAFEALYKEQIKMAKSKELTESLKKMTFEKETLEQEITHKESKLA